MGSQLIRLSVLCALAFSLTTQSVLAQNIGRLIREGDKYYLNGQYREALQYYKQGGNAGTWDKYVKLRVAICHYAVNDVGGAVTLLNDLVKAGKTDAMVYFYLGRAFQQRDQFKKAISEYKQFLRRARSNHPLIPWVKDEILRCANGNSLKYSDPNAYVENLGTAINTFHDEFVPVPSPSYSERLYFSSARAGTTGGMRNAEGTTDHRFGTYTADMFYAEHQNGIWRPAVILNRDLSTQAHESICDFSNDGQMLYFLVSDIGMPARLAVDTFSDAGIHTGYLSGLGPFDPVQGDRDLFIFNDTMFFFSSTRDGGYGGYDIYYAIKRRGKWLDARNLGPEINSFFDEVSPFLTRNGRVLYFSSNNKKSIGGLDIFRSDFSDVAVRWSTPVNLAPPINSAADDQHFRLASDGLSGYFASDRKSGYGLRDIYVAYMKEPVHSHITLSRPLTFAHVAPIQGSTEIPSQTPERREVKEYFIGDLMYETNDLVLTPQNIKKLDVLANLMLIYPNLQAELTCHDVSSGHRSFDLYFSIKKAEQAAEYLARKGVPTGRMIVRGCGSLYPKAQPREGSPPNPAVDRLNRRIEVRIHGAENEPISLIYEHQNIPEDLRSPRAAEFQDAQKGLIYRVQIATVHQLFQNSVLDTQDHAIIILDPDSRQYRYFVGLERTFEQAAVLRDHLRNMGFADAFIVAVIDGRTIPNGSLLNFAGQYPDLLNLIQSQK